MNKLIVTVFNSEESAFEGLSAMRMLHAQGDLSVYGSVVLAKDDDGGVSLKTGQDNAGSDGWLLGMLTGSLVGMLAGPAGLLAGASVGGLTGMLFDVDRAGIDAAFLDEVSAAMSPGKVALVLEADEVWTTPLDTRMQEHGGIVFRRLRSEVVEDQLARESAAMKAEMDALKEEIAEASDEAKASLIAQRDAAKAKYEAMDAAVKKQLSDVQAEADTKLATLNAQLEDASDRKRKKIEKRMADVKASLENRKEKLALAGQNLSEAFAI